MRAATVSTVPVERLPPPLMRAASSPAKLCTKYATAVMRTQPSLASCASRRASALWKVVAASVLRRVDRGVTMPSPRSFRRRHSRCITHPTCHGQAPPPDGPAGIESILLLGPAKSGKTTLYWHAVDMSTQQQLRDAHVSPQAPRHGSGSEIARKEALVVREATPASLARSSSYRPTRGLVRRVITLRRLIPEAAQDGGMTTAASDATRSPLTMRARAQRRQSALEWARQTRRRLRTASLPSAAPPSPDTQLARQRVLFCDAPGGAAGRRMWRDLLVASVGAPPIGALVFVADVADESAETQYLFAQLARRPRRGKLLLALTHVDALPPSAVPVVCAMRVEAYRAACADVPFESCSLDTRDRSAASQLLAAAARPLVCASPVPHQRHWLPDGRPRASSFDASSTIRTSGYL